MRILIVLTSHDRLGDTGEMTGFWLEELAAPYYVFKDAGAAIVLASPLGGKPPLDPRSDVPDTRTEATMRFQADNEAAERLASTEKLADARWEAFDAVFYPGGHGPMWDLAENASSIALVEAFLAAGKPIAAVCHAPVAFINARGANGGWAVGGRRLTGFANSEEKALGLEKVVPFLLEDRLIERGAHYRKAKDFEPYIEIDELVVTGQNPASSAAVAEALLRLLSEQARR